MPSIAVGVADLEGFTALSQRLTHADLTRLVVAFEQSAFDFVAAHGGRVVKTIGDEVMFAFDEPIQSALFATQLAALEDTELPPVRVGLGWGRVLVREGDCFGPVVNTASRGRRRRAGRRDHRGSGDGRPGHRRRPVHGHIHRRPRPRGHGRVELWRLEGADQT